ncbi:hypothetical protein SKAU_G00129650 [Synaphobranchus kaupii]|uniref:Uncharacterized protein n=1 Tax=Synaphobranchus kaupii TaxID=118154 RepID=A0A9Q1FQD1_SYNKA|nr:hypothetical protein SKAU_G00129650 [Synaphobranchus kaupii]
MSKLGPQGTMPDVHNEGLFKMIRHSTLVKRLSQSLATRAIFPACCLTDGESERGRGIDLTRGSNAQVNLNRTQKAVLFLETTVPSLMPVQHSNRQFKEASHSVVTFSEMAGRCAAHVLSIKSLCGSGGSRSAAPGPCPSTGSACYVEPHRQTPPSSRRQSSGLAGAGRCTAAGRVCAFFSTRQESKLCSFCGSEAETASPAYARSADALSRRSRIGAWDGLDGAALLKRGNSALASAVGITDDAKHFPFQMDVGRFTAAGFVIVMAPVGINIVVRFSCAARRGWPCSECRGLVRRGRRCQRPGLSGSLQS